MPSKRSWVYRLGLWVAKKRGISEDEFSRRWEMIRETIRG